MLNISISPISSVLLGFILVLVFIHYLVLIEFYYKNKDKLNNPECLDEKEIEYIDIRKEFRNESQCKNDFDSYYEVRKKEVK